MPDRPEFVQPQFDACMTRRASWLELVRMKRADYACFIRDKDLKAIKAQLTPFEGANAAIEEQVAPVACPPTSRKSGTA